MVATGGNQWQIRSARNPPKQAKSVAVGCHRLPEKFHGKQGVCRRLPPVAEGPLPVKEGVDASVKLSAERYFFLQSGHGHWSQPRPVHASRIMGAFYPTDDPGDALRSNPSAPRLAFNGGEQSAAALGRGADRF